MAKSSFKKALISMGVHTVDKICPKHNTKMMQYKDHEPYCNECAKEAIDGRESIMATKQNIVHKTTYIFNHKSIWGDTDVKNACFENYQISSDESELNLHKAKKIATAYLDKNNCFNSMLTGLAGRGKTHLALSILKGVNAKSSIPQSCLFVDVNQLFREIKASFSSYHSIENEMVQLLSSVDLLVMDDIGSESTFGMQIQPAKNWISNILFQIFSKRNRTIFTTNLNSSQLKQVYDPKLVSRMFKGLNANTIVKFTENTNDHRLVEF